MDFLLQRHQSIIRQLRKTEPIAYVKELLNEVVLFLNNTTNNQSDGLHILTVICHELAGFSTLKFFNNLEIMNHQFFIILSNTIRMLLTKVTFISLTKQDELCFDEISLLISNLCLNNNKISTCFYTDNNEKLNPNNQEIFHLFSYEKIFFTELFIKKFVRILENDIAINDYKPWDIKYKVIDRLLRLFIKLNDIDHKSILDSVVKCIESDIYINLYKTIDLRQPILSPKQSFFIYQCPKFICLHSYKRQDEISYSLFKSIIKYSPDIFEKHLPVALYMEDDQEEEEEEERGAKNQAIAWYIELFNHFALTPATREFFIKSKFKCISVFLAFSCRFPQYPFSGIIDLGCFLEA